MDREKKYTVRKMLQFFLSKVWDNNRKLLIFSLIQIPVLVVSPYINLVMQKMIIRGITQQYIFSRFLLIVFTGYTLILLIQTLSEWLEGRSEWYSRVLVNTLLKYVDEKTLHTDYKNVESAEGQQKRQKAVNAIYDGGQQFIKVSVSCMVNLCGFILYGITIFSYQKILFLITVVTAVVGYFFHDRLNKQEQKQKDRMADEDRKIKYLEKEVVATRAGREIRLYHMQNLLYGIYDKTIQNRLALEKNICRGRTYAISFVHVLSLVRNIFSYAFLIVMVYNGQIRVEDFIFLTGVVTGLSVWLQSFMSDLSRLHRFFMFFHDFFEYLDMPETEDTAECHCVLSTAPSVRFENVSFCYEDSEHEVLKNINLTIRPGEKIALVGRNGSGKTTFVKLLTGLYRPTKGRILVNDVDIAKCVSTEYFKYLAAVFQEILLLPVSIAQNVSSATDEKTDMNKAIKCLKKVDLWERVEILSEGIVTSINTQVKRNSTDLSMGEQQRLMIAKSIYKDSNLLVLDEPTAALDPVSENSIYQQYSELSAGKTSVFISHRLASTNFCDKIVLLDSGKIEEEGSHDSLMEKKGLYYTMYQEQSKYYRKGYDCKL